MKKVSQLRSSSATSFLAVRPQSHHCSQSKSLASDFALAVGNLTTKDPVLVFRMSSTGIDFKALLTSSVAWVSLAESVLPTDFGFTMRTCRSFTVLVCPKALTVMASS